MNQEKIGNYIKLKRKNKKITARAVEKEIEKITNKNKRIIMAYTKVALDNLRNVTNEITIKEMERQIQELKDLYTTEKLIEKANNL